MLSAGEDWISRTDQKTDNESTADVEEEDTDVYTFDGSGEVAARVLGFTGSDGDDLGTDERESGGTLHNDEV